MEMRGFCVGEKVFGGQFIEDKSGHFAFQRNDQIDDKKFTTPNQNLIDKVLQETDLENKQKFDDELFQLMTGG